MRAGRGQEMWIIQGRKVGGRQRNNNLSMSADVSEFWLKMPSHTKIKDTFNNCVNVLFDDENMFFNQSPLFIHRDPRFLLTNDSISQVASPYIYMLYTMLRLEHISKASGEHWSRQLSHRENEQWNTPYAVTGQAARGEQWTPPFCLAPCLIMTIHHHW